MTAPYHLLSSYTTSPVWALTNTTVNKNVSSAAQASDSSAISLDISGEPTIKLRASDGDAGEITVTTDDGLSINNFGNGVKIGANICLRASGEIFIEGGGYFSQNGGISYLGNSITNYATNTNLTIEPRTTAYNLLLSPTSTGNVGIGTTTPTGKLTIDGNKSTINLLEVINDNNGSVGDSSFVITKLGGATATSTILAPVVAVSSTDTISGTYPVGSMFVRITASDTSMWVKIRMTGVLSARWKKLTP